MNLTKKGYILFIITVLYISTAFSQNRVERSLVVVDFYGDSLSFPVDASVHVSFEEQLSKKSISNFYENMLKGLYQPMIQTLVQYRDEKKLDDWFYYQLIRTTAEKLSPKADNYHRYTLYKWFLLNESGYSSTTRFRNDTLLLYVRSEEVI